MRWDKNDSTSFVDMFQLKTKKFGENYMFRIDEGFCGIHMSLVDTGFDPLVVASWNFIILRKVHKSDYYLQINKERDVFAMSHYLSLPKLKPFR